LERALQHQHSWRVLLRAAHSNDISSNDPEKIFTRNRAVRPRAIVCAALMGLSVIQAARAFQTSVVRQPSTATPWTATVSHGDSASFHDGRFSFHAMPGRRADISRPLAQNLITFSARMSGWGSIYLVWNPNAWCALGQISPTPFARIYSAAVINGHIEQAKHRGVHLDSFRWMRIRLGENYISFAYSEDGQHWIMLRTISRPKEFSGAPHIAMAGKYYTSTDELFGSANVSIISHAPAEEVNGQTHGDWTDGQIQDLKIAATPPGKARLTDEELGIAVAPQPDPVMKLLSKTKNDPTYAQVVHLYPPMRFPREVVGVPLHPLDIGVDYLGRLNVNPSAPVAWLGIGAPSTPLGEPGKPLERRLFHGYLPIDILSATRDGVEYKMTVMGWSEGFSVERPLYAYIQLNMRSIGGKLPAVVFLLSPEGKKRTWRLTSKDGSSSQISIKMQFPDPNTAVQVPSEEFQSKMNETTKLWEERLSLATRFEVPDQRVMDAYRAWLAYSMLDTDTIDGRPEPHDGSGFYETMFGNSVSVYTMMLDEYGLHDYSARILQTQIHFQRPDGLYTAECGLVDPGAFLMGLAEHYRITGDKQWLESVAPAIIKQANWIIRTRNEAPKNGITQGLIKFRPYNDYLMPTFNYFGNVKCALGLLDAGEVLEELGIPEGKEFVNSAQSFRADILASMDASAFVSNGQTLLPMEPDTHRLLKLEDYNAGGYYGLTASPLLATGFLAPHDKRATWIVDALEKRGGLLAGLCEFNGGIDHAYTFGYLLNELKLGNVRKTILGFWSMFAFGMTRSTYSPVEVTMFKTGENELTLPHLYSCTEQLFLLRSMLLREDGDVLQLGEGIPRDWLSVGRHVAVDSAPTGFGNISYSIDVTRVGVDRVRILPPSRHPPTEIRLHLRMPNGAVVESIRRLSHTAGITYAGDVLTFRNLQQPVEVEAHFRKSA
jgi:hypothetical protein